MTKLELILQTLQLCHQRKTDTNDRVTAVLNRYCDANPSDPITMPELIRMVEDHIRAGKGPGT